MKFGFWEDFHIKRTMMEYTRYVRLRGSICIDGENIKIGTIVRVVKVLEESPDRLLEVELEISNSNKKKTYKYFEVRQSDIYSLCSSEVTLEELPEANRTLSSDELEAVSKVWNTETFKWQENRRLERQRESARRLTERVNSYGPSSCSSYNSASYDRNHHSITGDSQWCNCEDCKWR